MIEFAHSPIQLLPLVQTPPKPLQQVMPKISRIVPSQTPIDQNFWSQFSKDSWEKKSKVFKHFDSPIAELDQAYIFKLLVRYSDRCRKLKRTDGLKFYVAGERQHDEEILQILPVKKDKSLLGYHKRMNQIFADYCLVCDELLQVSLEKRDILVNFTHELYKHVGFPNRFSEMGLYLGNYRKTPFGVHVDGCGVFTFPVVGQKKFRIWKPEYVKKNPDLVEAQIYTKHKKNSELLTAEPGDMSYWPSSAWHIAESEGEFAAAWSLGVWLDKTHQEVIGETLQSLSQQVLGEAGGAAVTQFRKLQEANGEIKVLPDLYLQSLAKLTSLSEAMVRESLLKSWMMLISKQGLKVQPQVSTEHKIRLKDTVRIRSGQPILWAYLKSESRFVYVYGGLCIASSDSAEFLKLIKALNLEKPCRIDQYLKSSSRTEELRCLQTLADTGGIERSS
jgi:hypothetical protein